MNEPLSRKQVFDFDNYWRLTRSVKVLNFKQLVEFRFFPHLISRSREGISEKFYEEIKR